MDSYQEILVRIGNNVKKLRLAKNWSQEDLAYTADIDRTYIGYIENAKHNLSVKKLVQLANALEISFEDLLVKDKEDLSP